MKIHKKNLGGGGGGRGERSGGGGGGSGGWVGLARGSGWM